MQSPVVVIEDDDEIRDSIKDALETEGYLVKAFSNGKDALDELQSSLIPCLILLDLMMPIMNGWQFLEAKEKLTTPISKVPVFIVSAVADDKKVKQAGAIGYIRKPLDLNVLLKLVEDYCSTPKLLK